LLDNFLPKNNLTSIIKKILFIFFTLIDFLCF